MDLDGVCFERSETEDYNLEDLLIPPDPKSKHLIEYCVKVFLKGEITICPGDPPAYRVNISLSIIIHNAYYPHKCLKL